MLSLRRFIRILNAFNLDSSSPGAPAQSGGTQEAPSVAAPHPGAGSVPPDSALGEIEEIPVAVAGREVITPRGKRRLQVVRFVGGGKRANVYQVIEPESRQTYALKVIHERTPASLQSMALERAKVEALASHHLPHVRVIEMGATYALKEWVDGIEGDQWLREWKERGADPSDPAFRALVHFFCDAANKGVHITDLKPPNLMLRGGTEWVPVDPGLVIAPVTPQFAMKCYRERFVRRWLYASRSLFWAPVYWFWCQTKRAPAVANADDVRVQSESATRSILKPLSCQRGPSGLRFWGRGLVLPTRVQSLLVALDQPGGLDVEVLKRSTRRSVFRIRNVTTELPSVIVKGFPLAKIESRLKYRKYGLAEFSHYEQAASRGISMPACHGYFEVRALGLVKANGVVIEDLSGWRSLVDLVQADPARRVEILALAIPLLKRLYETGVNHIDPSPQNMLRSPDGAELRLIDWQYCSFVTPRQPAQLLLQASHFLRYADWPADSASAVEWLAKLAAACDWPKPADGLRRSVAVLLSHERLSAAARLALSPGPALLSRLEMP